MMDDRLRGRAGADFVKQRMGFSIGHPNGVFMLSPQQLAQLTGAPIADVVQEARP